MAKINVEICYAAEQQQKLLTLEVPEGISVVGAIVQSGILEDFPEIALNNNVGIFSKKVALNHKLQEGDRVEIYRPLKRSPNQTRLLRARSKQFSTG